MHTRHPAGLLVLTAFLTGCTALGRLRNLESPACRQSPESGVTQVLLAQGESADEAERLARRAVTTLNLSHGGPRPSALTANSGTG